MPRIIKLTDRIQYLQVSYDPLSADVVAVRGDSAWWIFDVGACDEAVNFINALPRNPVGSEPLEKDSRGSLENSESAAPVAISLKKNIVISHFHRDHLLNLVRFVQGEVSLDFDAVYLGSYASKVVGEVAGCEKIAVTSPISFDDGVKIQILPMPNSPTKPCV